MRQSDSVSGGLALSKMGVPTWLVLKGWNFEADAVSMRAIVGTVATPDPGASFRINRALWDERAAAHAASPDYGFARFAADADHISDVVAFDRPLLGSVEGLRGVHLQCHIGTDTVSLARLGARMTGLDFSAESLRQARRLAALARAGVDFVESGVYGALEVLERETFDLVYTGIGALIWLPDIERWADVVAGLLRPGGRLFVREGHPMLMTLADPRPDGALAVELPYFRQAEPTVWDEGGTYVSTDVVFRHTVSHEWHHGLGEVVTALLGRGLRLTTFVEHDTVPWEARHGEMEDAGGGEYRLRDRPWRLPCTYTIGAVKEGG